MARTAGDPPAGTPAVDGKFFDRMWFNWFREFYRQLVGAQGNISTNAANIATNAANIVTNTANIATNTTNIATNTAAIAAGAKLIQTVTSSTGAVATGNTQIPRDDTIPQNTEGNQYLSLSITPTSATSRLSITAVLNGDLGGSQHITAALFQDSTASALMCGSQGTTSGSIKQLRIEHDMVAGTTSATTFNIRVGADGAGTYTLNGLASARNFGGVLLSSIKIVEYTA